MDEIKEEKASKMPCHGCFLSYMCNWEIDKTATIRFAHDRTFT
jgi:hypothetical protein